jgi:hypothetical protein
MIDRQEARSDVARIDPAADRWLHNGGAEPINIHTLKMDWEPALKWLILTVEKPAFRDAVTLKTISIKETYHLLCTTVPSAKCWYRIQLSVPDVNSET